MMLQATDQIFDTLFRKFPNSVWMFHSITFFFSLGGAAHVVYVSYFAEQILLR